MIAFFEKMTTSLTILLLASTAWGNSFRVEMAIKDDCNNDKNAEYFYGCCQNANSNQPNDVYDIVMNSKSQNAVWIGKDPLNVYGLKSYEQNVAGLKGDLLTICYTIVSRNNKLSNIQMNLESCTCANVFKKGKEKWGKPYPGRELVIV